MNDEESQRLAANYRREACFLLSDMAAHQSTSSNAGLLKDMEQSLGRKCLLKDASLVEESEALSAVPLASELDMKVPPSFLHCLGCGSWLQPGTNGTTVRLRTLGRGKTRRRRASRQKAKRYLAKQQASAKGGRQWKRDSGTADLVKDNDLLRVTDGSCKNAIVYTCGSCGTKRKLKGLAAAVSSAKPKETVSEKESGPKSKKSDVSAGADFIPVAAAVSKPITKQRIEPRKRKRGKKKGPTDKDSKLLDFLSSLNDA